MPEPNVLYTVTAVVVAGLVAWVLFVLKTAKEPWARPAALAPAAPVPAEPEPVKAEEPVKTEEPVKAEEPAAEAEEKKEEEKASSE